MEAEAFAGENFAAEFIVLAVEPEEGFYVAGEGFGDILADKAAVVFGGCPGCNRVAAVTAGIGVTEASEDGSLAWGKGGKLFFHFFVKFVVMGLEDQGIAEGVAVVKHFFHMFPAESGFVCLITDITFHIRRTVSENEIKGVLLQFPFDEAEWAFIVGVYGIVKWDGI